MVDFYGELVGKYTGPMDPLGFVEGFKDKTGSRNTRTSKGRGGTGSVDFGQKRSGGNEVEAFWRILMP